MPWTFQRYPASMKHLPVIVREKAIEIANALLEDGYPEGQSIRIGIARAKEWAERRSLPDGTGFMHADTVEKRNPC